MKPGDMVRVKFLVSPYSTSDLGFVGRRWGDLIRTSDTLIVVSMTISAIFIVHMNGAGWLPKSWVDRV